MLGLELNLDLLDDTEEDPVDLIRELTRISRRCWLKPPGSGVVSGSSYVDDGSTSTGGTPLSPKIHCFADGASQQAQAAEYFNQDPWSYANLTADHMFALRNVIHSFMTVSNDSTTPATGARFGISFGEVITYPAGAPSETQASIMLLYNYVTATWQAIVINKYGAATHKTFIVDLGAAPQGINPFVFGRTFRLLIDYHPNAKVDFYINDALVLTFTDAANGGGFTPLGDLYANETTVGLTLKGGVVYAVTGNNAASRSHAFFEMFECYTVLAR